MRGVVTTASCAIAFHCWAALPGGSVAPADVGKAAIAASAARVVSGAQCLIVSPPRSLWASRREGASTVAQRRLKEAQTGANPGVDSPRGAEDGVSATRFARGP